MPSAICELVGKFFPEGGGSLMNPLLSSISIGRGGEFQAVINTNPIPANKKIFLNIAAS
jgi:hypothetical protein